MNLFNDLISLTFESQIQKINELTKSHKNQGQTLKARIEEKYASHLIKRKIHRNTLTLTRACVISIYASQIQSIPDTELQKPFWIHLENICKHYSITLDDIADLLEYYSLYGDLFIDENI